MLILINKITEDLYQKYKENKYIIKIIQSNIDNIKDIKNIEDINKLIQDDNLTKFRLYFRYDTFHLLHSLLCSLINNKIVNEKKLQ